MQFSNWVTVFGVIMASFKIILPIDEPMKAHSSSWSHSKKSLYLIQLLHYIPCDVLFLKKLKCRKKYLYNKYIYFNIIMINGTKEGRKTFSVPTPDRQPFAIYTKKPHRDKYQNQLQKHLKGHDLSLFLSTTHWKDYNNFITEIKLIF